MDDERDAKRPWLTRRAVLTAAGALAGGLATAAGCKYRKQLFLIGSPPEAESERSEWAGSRVRAYRPLGRTGFEISDISFGCSDLNDPTVAQRALERGINYFDTSPDYANADSEIALGEGIRGFPRDRVFIASKFCTPKGHLKSGTPVTGVIAAVEESLRRLGTDYLDLVHIHAVNSVDRLMAASIHEAFDRLKEAGKVRFLGVSSHTADLERVMHHAVDCGRFDVIMAAYNFKSWPELAEHLPQGPPARRRCRRDEDVEGRPPQQARGLHADGTGVLRPGGLQVGALEPERQRSRDLDRSFRADRRVSLRLGSGRHSAGPRPAGEVRSPRRARVLPARLRRLPGPLPARRSHRRRPALRNVRGELRPPEAGDAPVLPHPTRAARRPLPGMRRSRVLEPASSGFRSASGWGGPTARCAGAEGG